MYAHWQGRATLQIGEPASIFMIKSMGNQEPGLIFYCMATRRLDLCFVVGLLAAWTCTVALIKFLPYSGATAQTRSVALWGVSGSYGQAPAQQGMSGLVRETSHLWLYSSPSPSLKPILREPATSILVVLYAFEYIMWVATESLWRYVQGNKWILKLHFHNVFAMWLKWCTETTY